MFRLGDSTEDKKRTIYCEYNPDKQTFWFCFIYLRTMDEVEEFKRKSPQYDFSEGVYYFPSCQVANTEVWEGDTQIGIKYVNKSFIAVQLERHIGEDVNICYMIIRRIKK